MAKENFKVGDYVIITKSDSNWATDMNKYVGKRAQLTKTTTTGFRIDLDGGRWIWVFTDGHFTRDQSIYIPSPAPKDATTLRVIKDITLKKEWPRMPDIIPSGSLTWYVFPENTPITLENRKSIHIEDNRYCANIPAEYFEIVDNKMPEEWIPKIGDVLTLTNFKDNPIVTITNVLEDSMEGCKWVKFEPAIHYGGGFRVNLKCLPRTNGYYLGRDFTVNSTNETDTKWIPQVGEYAIMERAGGWGYHPDNNGCLAIIDAVGERKVGADLVRNCISGRVLNPKCNIGKWSYVKFVDVPVIGRDDEIVCRKALPHEISVAAIVESGPKLNHFPQEGCVYESPENMKGFVNYLLNRPGREDGKIYRSDAIGIAWNHSSCWWLKTKASTKTVYSLYDLNNFLSIPNSTPIHKLPEKWYVKATKENEEILKKWRNGEHTGWSNDLVMKSSKYWDNETDTIKQGFLEISYNDFLRYVYHPEQNTGYIEFSYKKETEKYSQEDNKIVIPSISPVKVNIDYSIKTISKISLPDFTVEPIKVESIIVKPFKLNY